MVAKVSPDKPLQDRFNHPALYATAVSPRINSKAGPYFLEQARTLSSNLP